MATALITGGTSGIGAEFARQLAASGWDLVLVARDTARLEQLREELPTEVEVLPADLADRQQADAVARRLEDPARPIELLVNNAGFSVHTRLLDPDMTNHDLGYEVMARAVHVLSAAAARAMAGRGSGRIINVASTAGFVTLGSYSALKAWVISFTESLAVELRGTGVKATALCPGWVRTEFHARGNVSTSKIPGPLWIPLEPLVRDALRDSARGKVVSIPSARYKALIWVARHAPRRSVRWASGKISSGRGIPAGAAEATAEGADTLSTGQRPEAGR